MSGTSTHADVALLNRHATRIKKSLYRRPAGLLRYPYLVAGPESFPYLVDWDAIWGGMAYLIDGDPEPLRNSLLNLLDHVAPGGKGQRVIKPEAYGAPVFQIRPFVATGAWVLTRELNSTDWLPTWAWSRLREYLLYWHVHRTGRHGLLKWWHVDEGFADNGLGNWAWDNNSVEATDLNAQMTLENLAAAAIADRLGLLDEADEHRRLATAIRARIEQILWHEEDGCYYSIYNPAERGHTPYPIRVHHYTNLWPLWTGIAAPARARQIIERYVLSPDHFWSKYGIRSMSRADPRYHNAASGMGLPMAYPAACGPAATCANWQGPVWAIVNYLAAAGLKRYGYDREARTVAGRMIRNLAKSVRATNGMCEDYDAETGQPVGRSGGLGSWCLMLRFLPDHLRETVPWFMQGLDIPWSREGDGA